MMPRGIQFGLPGLTCVAVLLLAASRGFCRDIKVDPAGAGEFTTIGSAVAAAGPGDSILVAAGTYAEPLLIEKPLEIIGQGASPADVIIESHQKSALRVTADGVTVRGLSLKGGDNYPNEDDAAYFTVAVPKGKLTLVDCRISSAAGSQGSAAAGARGEQAELILDRCAILKTGRNGVRVFDGAKLTIIDSEIANAPLQNVGVTGSTATLYRCTIHNADNGVVIEHGSTANVIECNVYNNVETQVKIVASKATVLRCKTHGAKKYDGIYIANDADAQVIGCEMSGNAVRGLNINSDAKATISYCVIHSNDESGVLVSLRATPTIINCWIFKNGVSGVLSSYKGDVTVRDCDLHDNFWQDVWAADDSRATVENSRLHGPGNYGANVSDAGSKLTLRNVNISGKTFAGVVTREQGTAIVEGSTITYNDQNGIIVKNDGYLFATQTLISNNNGPGVHTMGKASGKVEACNLMSNGGDPYVIEGEGTVEFIDNEE